MTRILYHKVAQGERLLASDMLDLTFFPIGTILMYDGSNWTDGRGGWYICNASNKALGRTPDLSDKFIKGNGTTAKEGGSTALTSEKLPKHTHGVTINATTNLNGSFPAIHTQSYTGEQNTSGIARSSNVSLVSAANGGQSPYGGVQFSIYADHNHTGSASNDNSSTSDSNTSNMPSYYSVIYIRKCE